MAFTTGGFWLLLIGYGASANAQGYCSQLHSLAQQNWRLYTAQQDPGHRAAAQNYQNFWSVYCRGGSSSGYSAPTSGTSRATNVAGALAGMLGIIAALGMTEQEVAVPRATEAPRTGPSAEEMDRLRREADSELAEAHRRCQQNNPFLEPGQYARGCRPESNPFVDPEDSPSYDSVKKRDCKGVIDFGNDGCIPDDIREVLAGLKGQIEISIPRHTQEGYESAVLSEDQIRRLAGGEDFENVTAPKAGLLDAVTSALIKRLDREMASLDGKLGSRPRSEGRQPNPFQ